MESTGLAGLARLVMYHCEKEKLISYKCIIASYWLNQLNSKKDVISGDSRNNAQGRPNYSKMVFKSYGPLLHIYKACNYPISLPYNSTRII